MFCNFDGEILVSGSNRPDEIITCELRPDLIREARIHWCVLAHAPASWSVENRAVENNIYQFGHRAYVRFCVLMSSSLAASYYRLLSREAPQIARIRTCATSSRENGICRGMTKSCTRMARHVASTSRRAFTSPRSSTVTRRMLQYKCTHCFANSLTPCDCASSRMTCRRVDGNASATLYVSLF